MRKNTSDSKWLDGRDPKSGQFVMGFNGGPGRPKGSRNRLTTEFLDDVYAAWRKRGPGVIDAVIRDKPHEFLKIVAGLMPKELHAELDINVDLFRECQSFAQAFRLARQVIGAEVSRDDEAVLIEQFEPEQ